MVDSPKQAPDAKLVELLEKQNRELVVRVLKQHEEVQHSYDKKRITINRMEQTGLFLLLFHLPTLRISALNQKQEPTGTGRCRYGG